MGGKEKGTDDGSPSCGVPLPQATLPSVIIQRKKRCSFWLSSDPSRGEMSPKEKQGFRQLGVPFKHPKGNNSKTDPKNLKSFWQAGQQLCAQNT